MTQDQAAARHADGSAGDADYAAIGPVYARYRQRARILAAIVAALGDARTVLNVGVGTGSYEPTDRAVTAVEPSASMRARRPPRLPPAIDAAAERLPFEDGRFEASMATFSVHQWPDLEGGLRGMRRVTRGPVLILSCDPAELHRFWLRDYAPEVIAVEARRYPDIAGIAAALGASATVVPVPIPLDCTDGFRSITAGRRACSIPRRGWPARPGVSSRRRSPSASTAISGPISAVAHGTPPTATCAQSRILKVRCG